MGEIGFKYIWKVTSTKITAQDRSVRKRCVFKKKSDSVCGRGLHYEVSLIPHLLIVGPMYISYLSKKWKKFKIRYFMLF